MTDDAVGGPPPGVGSDDSGLEPFSELDEALDRSLAGWRSRREPLTVLFSGGIDSGLLAWELRARPATTLFTVGRQGSPDLLAAESATRRISLPWVSAEVESAEFVRIWRSIESEVAAVPRVSRSVHLAFAVAVARAPEGELLCGQGADELFLGYAHYRRLGAGLAAERSRSDLDLLLHEEWPRAVRIAAGFGRSVRAPYLDPTFVAAALAVPIERRMPDPVPKAFWRRWASHRGVPSEIVERPKRALQYGTQFDRWARDPAPPSLTPK